MENQTNRPAVVTRADIIEAFGAVGVSSGDILLIHSSLRSFGRVDGGAQAVIDAAKNAVTPEGTVVFPTLVQRDFENAYRNWDIQNTPSDTGAITEAFRLLPDSLRSDQATHSVAAWGARAEELTCEHGAYGPRMGIFGDYAFSYSSPWQKMYLLGARIVFIGVDMVYNTFKHFVEYRMMERLLAGIADERERCRAMGELYRYNRPGVWPLHDGKKTQAVLDEMGLVRYAHCGASLFTSVWADEYVDQMTRLFLRSPEEWFNAPMMDWLNRYVRR